MEIAGIRIGIVTGSRVDTNRDGTQPGRILQAIITDSNDVQNVQTCQAGDEFNPPRGCSVILGAGGDAYKVQLHLDDGIAPAMDPGGKRIYATDESGEAEVAEVRLHPNGKMELFNEQANVTVMPDGGVTVTNGAASFTMSADGHFTFHGVGSTFDHPVTMQHELTVQGATELQAGVNVTGDAHATGTVTGQTDVVAGTISGKGHQHTSNIAGLPTSVPLN